MSSRGTWRPTSVLIPVFNDFSALSLLVVDLANVLEKEGLTADLIVVDDASESPVAESLPSLTFKPALTRITVLRLRRNMGHQRAIAVGLCYLSEESTSESIIVMDGDGEDRPSDIAQLLAEFRQRGGTRVIFAERIRRSETITFRFFYHLYRSIHFLLTGISVRFGNFSVLPATLLHSLVVSSELWNHYAAAVLKAKLPYATTPIPRGMRLSGKSQLNFTALAVHGLSAISVFGDIIGVRLLLASLVVAIVSGSAFALAILLRTSQFSSASSLTLTAGLTLVLACQALIAACGFVFVILASRANTNVIPLRDYKWFVQTRTVIPPIGS